MAYRRQLILIIIGLFAAELPNDSQTCQGAEDTTIVQQVYGRADPGIIPPKMLKRVEPIYSPEAQKASLEGTVVVSAVIYEDGLARDATVLYPLGLGLDEAALGCLEKWRFLPAMKDGKAVRVFANFEINFRLIGFRKGHVRVSHVNFASPPETSRPILVKGKGIPYNSAAKNAKVSGTVHITAWVSEIGTLESMVVKGPLGSGLDEDAMQALSEWRFQPARRQGQVVRVPIAIAITFF